MIGERAIDGFEAVTLTAPDDGIEAAINAPTAAPMPATSSGLSLTKLVRASRDCAAIAAA